VPIFVGFLANDDFLDNLDKRDKKQNGEFKRSQRVVTDGDWIVCYSDDVFPQLVDS